VLLAPVVNLAGHDLAMASKGRNPRHTPVSQISPTAFVDFDQIVSVSKADLAQVRSRNPIPSPAAARLFTETAARHLGRAALPDDLAISVDALRERLVSKHGKASEEGVATSALLEIRVAATPDWSSASIDVLAFFFVPAASISVPGGPTIDPAAWERWVRYWEGLIRPTGVIHSIRCVPTTYAELDALTYRSSDPLDLEYLSSAS
jgi:hypothetical protein